MNESCTLDESYYAFLERKTKSVSRSEYILHNEPLLILRLFIALRPSKVKANARKSGYGTFNLGCSKINPRFGKLNFGSGKFNLRNGESR